MRENHHWMKVSTGRALTRPRLDVSAFGGEWVALHPKTYEVIGHGPSLEKAQQSTSNIGRIEPVLYFVPKSDTFVVGRAQ